MPDAVQMLDLTVLFCPLRHLLTIVFFGFHFEFTDLLIRYTRIESSLVRNDVPADHHEVILVGHVVAVDQISAAVVSELHLDQCALPGLESTDVLSSRHERRYGNLDSVYKSLQSTELFEVNVYRVGPAGGDVVVQEPLFSSSLKDTVSRVVRIERAANRIEWPLNPEPATHEHELPLPAVVGRRQRRIRAKGGWNRARISREPWFSVHHVELHHHVSDVQSWRQWIRRRVADKHGPVLFEIKLGTSRELCEVDD